MTHAPQQPNTRDDITTQCKDCGGGMITRLSNFIKILINLLTSLRETNVCYLYTLITRADQHNYCSAQYLVSWIISNTSSELGSVTESLNRPSGDRGFHRLQAVYLRGKVSQMLVLLFNKWMTSSNEKTFTSIAVYDSNWVISSLHWFLITRILSVVWWARVESCGQGMSLDVVVRIQLIDGQ